MQISMVKVEIIGPKGLFFDTLSVLHRLGTLHLEDFSKEPEEPQYVHPMEVDVSSGEKRQNLEALLVRINSILSELEPQPQKASAEEKEKVTPRVWPEDTALLTQEVNTLISELETKAAKLATQKSNLENELSLLKSYEPLLEKIQPLAKEVTTAEGFETIALLTERRYKTSLAVLENDLRTITKGQANLVSTDIDEETTAAIIIFNRTYATPVRQFLREAEVNEVRLPPELAEKPFKESYEILKEQKKVLPQKIAVLQEELAKISGQWFFELKSLKALLEDRLAELQVIPKFGATSYAFFIRGWLPEKEVKTVSEVLKREVGEDVTLSRLKLTSEEWEEAPVVLKNPSWAQPFQFFYKLVKPPKYGTVDPTSFVAIFFPILFGLIVGDLGYGLVISLLALLIRRRLKGLVLAQVFSSIALIAGLSAMFFGTFFFFEFFGNLSERLVHSFWQLEPPYFKIAGFGWPIIRGEPEKSFPILLTMALSIGVIHLSLGFLFGVINGLRTHQLRHVFEKGGFLLLILSLVFITLSLAHFLPPYFQYLAFPLLGLGVLGIGYGGGVKGVTEIFGTFANIVSYSRLMALSLAGVIMADSINILAEKMGALGPIAIIGGIFLAVFLHSINIIISVLSPSVHSLRLHLVECFSKFYEPAQAPYEPFKTLE